ncbi:MAG: hypothetical protein Q9159_002054 [Coniocarpon cinnabarinum]
MEDIPNRGHAYNAVVWVLTGVAVGSVALRVLSRTKLFEPRRLVAAFFIIFAIIENLTAVIITTIFFTQCSPAAGTWDPELSLFNGVAVVCALIALTRLFALALVRVYGHPLSNFPGPKLAAVSTYWEFYMDFFVQGGGQFHAKLQKLHDEYGVCTDLRGL